VSTAHLIKKPYMVGPGIVVFGKMVHTYRTAKQREKLIDKRDETKVKVKVGMNALRNGEEKEERMCVCIRTSKQVQIRPKNVISQNMKDATWKENANVHMSSLENAQAMRSVKVMMCHSMTRCTLSRGCSQERFSRYVLVAFCIPTDTWSSLPLMNVPVSASPLPSCIWKRMQEGDQKNSLKSSYVFLCSLSSLRLNDAATTSYIGVTTMSR
jgi:peroxiredoxin family protein